MSDIGQATFVGGNLIIRCTSKMTCCQREQAQAKASGLNQECPMQIRKRVTPNMNRLKKNCQARETGRMLREMKANGGDPKNNATSSCLGDQMKKDFNDGKQSTSEMKVQMDHPREVKFYGNPVARLKALDEQVNGLFGEISQKQGDKMLAQKPPVTQIESVSFICKPPCPPPKKADRNKDYSCGRRKVWPKNAA